MNVEARTTLDISNLKEGRKWYWKTRKRLRLIRWIYPVAGLLLLVCFFLQSAETNATYPPVAFLIIGVILMLSPALWNWQFKRTVQRMTNFGKEIHWRFEDTHMHLAFGENRSSIAYDSLFHTYITPTGLLILQQQMIFLWLPVASFSSHDEFTKVVEHLREHSAFAELK